MVDHTPPTDLVTLADEVGAVDGTISVVIRPIVAGLGAAAEEEVTSPTFTMIHEYGPAPGAPTPVYHVDLYRVETARELETLGLEDLLSERAVVIIEWGERLGPALRPSGPGSVIEIQLEAKGDAARRIAIQPVNKTEI